MKRSERKRRRRDPNTGSWRIQPSPGEVVYRDSGEPMRFETKEAAEQAITDAGWGEIGMTAVQIALPHLDLTQTGRTQELTLASLSEAVRRIRELPPMTEDERNEQAACFAYGNLALMREYHDASPEKLEALRQMCRKAAGCK